MALLPTNQRDQGMVLVCFLAVALAGSYWNWVWSPKNETLSALEQRVDTLEVRNDSARADLARGTVSELQAEADRLARDLEVMRLLVPVSNELPALLEQVSTAARREGLDLSAVEPQPVNGTPCIARNEAMCWSNARLFLNWSARLKITSG